MSPPDPYERLLNGALFCLSDYYGRALRSGAIALQLNGHNLVPQASSSILTSAHEAPPRPKPLEFGTVLITETIYIDPRRNAWVHGELHVKASVDFGDNEIFSMEEKIRGSGVEVMEWGRDFTAKLGSWCIGKMGIFKVMTRKVEVEEAEGWVGDIKTEDE
jgi:hypothetical protein